MRRERNAEIGEAQARERAQELHERGMPFQMAMAVAYGRLELSDALERMAIQDKATRLMEQHALSRALAVQVAKGHADLDAILMRRRMEAYVAHAPLRSCLEDAMSAGAQLTLGLHGQRTVRGRVHAVEPYSVTVVPATKKGDGEPEEIHKLQIKYAHAPDDWKVVRKVLRWDKAVSAEEHQPIERPQDRYTCSTRRLFRYLDGKLQVQAVLLEGEILRGHLDWFSRYELGLEVKTGVVVTLFRHALHDLRSVT